MTGLLLFSVLLLAWSSASSPGQPDHLNHHNDDLDVFCYNPCYLVVGHQRVVQGLATGLNFSFQAFGRTLDLSLFPEKDVFSSTPTVHYSDGSVQDVDVSHLYQGTVRGVPGSSVYLSVLDGQADGSMVLPGEATYYIEPVSRHFSALPSDRCALDQTQMAKTVASGEGNSKEDPNCSAEDCLKLQEFVDLSSCDASNGICFGCAVVRRTPTFHEEWISCRESRKQVRYFLFWNNVCNLHMYADPTLWRHFKYERFGDKLTDEKTSEEIEKFFAGHVSALKRIFGNTEFSTYDGREMFRGIDFEMERSTIMTDTTEKCNTSRPNGLCSPDLTLNQLRSNMSIINHDKYCLAIFFTYRNFDEVLGETQLPSPFQPGAGICDRYMAHLSEQGLEYKSRNFVWLTFLGRQKTYSEKTSHLLLAHEVGHALGSPHDDGPDCVPGADSPAGNYLMYDSVPGLKENNEKFSSCSKDNITRFLSSVVYSRHGRRNCLKRSFSVGGLWHRYVSSVHQNKSHFSTFSRKPDDEL